MIEALVASAHLWLPIAGTVVVAALGAMGGWLVKAIDYKGSKAALAVDSENKRIDQLQEDLVRMAGQVALLSKEVEALKARENGLVKYVFILWGTLRKIDVEIPEPPEMLKGFLW